MKNRKKTVGLTIVLVSLLVSLLTTSLATPVSAQEDSAPALPGISVTKVANPPDVAPSSNVTFTITVPNTGDCTLDPVRVVDTLLGWMSYVSSSPAADTHDGTIIWNNVGPLDPGDSKTITLVALHRFRCFWVSNKRGYGYRN